MKNKILTGLLLVLIGGWGSLSAQNVGSNYARQVNTLIGTKGVGLTSGFFIPEPPIHTEWCSSPPLIFPNVPDSSSIS